MLLCTYQCTASKYWPSCALFFEISNNFAIYDLLALDSFRLVNDRRSSYTHWRTRACVVDIIRNGNMNTAHARVCGIITVRRPTEDFG